MNKIGEYYEKDHDRLDGLFRSFQEWKRKDFAKAKEYFVEFKFGLQRHIIWEEEILFPIYETKTGNTYGPTDVMRMEHRQIGTILEAIHQKAKESDPETGSEEARLLEVLGNHNVKEELLLYPAIDRLVDVDEIPEIFAKMESIPEERYKVCCGAEGERQHVR